jgi:hypothetical protein
VASFVENLSRSRDLLDAQLEFFNLTLDTADPGRPLFRRAGTGLAALEPNHTGSNQAWVVGIDNPTVHISPDYFYMDRDQLVSDPHTRARTHRAASARASWWRSRSAVGGHPDDDPR